LALGLRHAHLVWLEIWLNVQDMGLPQMLLLAVRMPLHGIKTLGL
jgi:hypothetical protein